MPCTRGTKQRQQKPIPAETLTGSIQGASESLAVSGSGGDLSRKRAHICNVANEARFWRSGRCVHLSKHALAKLYIASCSEPFATAKRLSLQEGASCSVVQQIKRLHDATVEISEAASSPSCSATPPSQHFHRNVPPSRNRYIGGRTLNYMIQRSKHASKPACLPQLPALLKRPSGCVKGNPFKLGAPRPIPRAIVSQCGGTSSHSPLKHERDGPQTQRTSLQMLRRMRATVAHTAGPRDKVTSVCQHPTWPRTCCHPCPREHSEDLDTRLLCARSVASRPKLLLTNILHSSRLQVPQ